MPDDPINGAASQPPSDSELEKLFDDAIAPMPTASTRYKCAKCTNLTDEQCPGCQGPMCEDHRSPLSPDFCCTCYPDNTIVEEPLKNAEGTIVDGRHLIVQQSQFRTFAKTIWQMSDDELATYITKYTTEITLHSKTLEAMRCNLNTAKMEQLQRNEIKRRQLRATKFAPPAQAKAKPQAAKPQMKPLSQDMIRQLTEMLFKQQQARARAAQEKNEAKPNETN